MRILVFGKTGMVGQAVFRRLAAHKDWTVHGTQRSSPSAPDFFNVGQDLVNLEDLLSEKPYDYVINCIGVLKGSIIESDSDSLRSAIIVNALFPHVLASIVFNRHTHIIHLSTDGVFSGRSADPYFEDSVVDCVDHYGRTKALGECPASNVLNIRCSIIGRDPINKRGVFEWFNRQAEGATIVGFQNSLWNGVTTTQFASLCRKIIADNQFMELRHESSIHHFCPNPSISKYELLCLFSKITEKAVAVTKDIQEGPQISRVLGTRFGHLKGIEDVAGDWDQVIFEMIHEGG